MKTEQVELTIDTVAPRLVRIYGTVYRLRAGADMTLAEGLSLERLRDQFVAITREAAARELTADEVVALSAVIAKLAVLATDAPPDVIQPMLEGQKMQLIQTAFFVAPRPTAATPGTRRAPRTSGKRLGKRRSRG